MFFKQRLSSAKGRLLQSKFIFNQRSFSIKSHLPSEVVFHQRLSSIKGCLPSKVVFLQRSSSIKGCLPSKVVLCFNKLTITGRPSGGQKKPLIGARACSLTKNKTELAGRVGWLDDDVKCSANGGVAVGVSRRLTKMLLATIAKNLGVSQSVSYKQKSL